MKRGLALVATTLALATGAVAQEDEQQDLTEI